VEGNYKVKRIVRGVLAVLAFGLSLELCARVDDLIRYRAPFWSNYTYDSMFTVDALGRTGKPNASFRDYRLNSLGFRGPEIQPGGTRVVCIGASETFGLYEDPGQEFPRQLEFDLNTQSPATRYQVVNAGLVGQSIRTAAARIPQYVQEFHPQFAVVYPTPASYIWLPWIETTPATRAAAQSGLQLRSADKIRDATKRLSPPALLDYLRRKDIDREATAFGTARSTVSEESVTAFRSDLAKIVDVLRSNGVTPILVTHANRFGPTLSEKDREELTAWRRFYPMLTEHGFLDMEERMNDAIRSLAAEKSVALVDGARIVPQGDEYFGDAIHFTTKGSSNLAAAISQKILERPN
jgi:lysophospholipase L1-like esterase